MFGVGRSMFAAKGISIMIMSASTNMSTLRSSYDPRVRRI